MPDAAVIASRLYLPPAAACRYAPYPARFVAANSAFSVFRFAKRRKPLRLRSSSPKVFRLSGSPLNHRRRFAGYAHQGEVPDKTVQNEFPTMRAKRSWGCSTGQRLPPPRTDFRTIGHIDELHSETGARPPVRGLGGGSRSGMAQGVCRAPVPHPPTLAGVFKKKRRRQSGFQHLRSPQSFKGRSLSPSRKPLHEHR